MNIMPFSLLSRHLLTNSTVFRLYLSMKQKRYSEDLPNNRAQRALSPGNFYTAIRGMRPGPAFAQHAPQLCEQKRIYESSDASSAPIFFCIISKISLCLSCINPLSCCGKNPLFFSSSIHCLNSKNKCLKINGIKLYLLSLFLSQVIGYKQISWHC